MAAVAGQVEHPERLATQEVSYNSEGAKICGYLARPRESGRHPGVIILHDIFGVSDNARDVARRFANAGFITLVPDCFARIELGTDESNVRVRANLNCWGGSITRDTGVTELHPVPVVALVKNLKRPVYAVFGADDENPSPAHAAELRAQIEREGRIGLVTMESFANAGHAFFADTRPDRYRERAALELWPKMVVFFRAHLS